MLPAERDGPIVTAGRLDAGPGGRLDAGSAAAGGGPQSPYAREAALLLGEARALLEETRAILAQPSVEVADAPPKEQPPLRSRRFRVPASRGLWRRLPVVAVGCAGVALTAAGADGLLSAQGQTPAPGPVAPARLAPVAAAPPASANRSFLPVTLTGIPLSVSVPRLGSTAAVTSEVAVEASGPERGLLTAPANYHQLGWYRHGASGVLVIDGHVGFRQDPGPLAYIGQLVPGDTVVVAYNVGPRSYRVTQVARAVKGQLPPGYFSAPHDGQVMLITCDYTSTFQAGHFADNVYVVTSPG